jgi:hypothetical protein
MQAGAYNEDWCPHLLNEWVPLRLSCKWVIIARICVPHRLDPVKDAIIGFPCKIPVYCDFVLISFDMVNSLHFPCLNYVMTN